MLVLYETAMGFALFKLTDSAKLTDPNLYQEFDTPERANELLKLKSLHRFTSTATAVEEITSIQEGKLGKGLKEFLNKNKEELVIVDPRLGAFSFVITDLDTLDLFRGIRSQLGALLNGLDPKDLATMSLGLSHSLSRFKLKFSPDKVDTMVIQAIALLDDLDKEINIYAMRVKEWYGWHFPEIAKILSDNLAYAKVVKLMGFRTNAIKTDFAAILPEELEATIKAAAEISMGTEISESDLAHIHALCDQVISISEYRAQLSEYLRNRMVAIAPNLTAIVGELVGARLISHAGSLLNLAKHPASTVQILGAEKALFRALKTKHDTPKYGLIYHASLVGQAPPKLKGKMARMVATKTALSVRVDALTDADEKSTPSAPSIGLENRARLEARLRALEAESDAAGVRRFATGPHHQKRVKLDPAVSTYNPAADAVGLVSTQREPIESAVKATLDVQEEKRRAKEERRAKKRAEMEKAAELTADGDADADAMEVDGKEGSDEKKHKRRKSDVVAAVEDGAVAMEGVETEAERKARKQARKAEKAAKAGKADREASSKKRKSKATE
ncbi:Nop-domain-containing protein [Russula earlei]|uniref:Nop-domain-containing protein n=1 Tax=Russula earlei TaxID=71964 RepID=A0ACC0TRH9_9AGAM|nr:Nop-domain-containing protein [Russula earlei]